MTVPAKHRDVNIVFVSLKAKPNPTRKCEEMLVRLVDDSKLAAGVDARVYRSFSVRVDVPLQRVACLWPYVSWERLQIFSPISPKRYIHRWALWTGNQSECTTSQDVSIPKNASGGEKSKESRGLQELWWRMDSWMLHKCKPFIWRRHVTHRWDIQIGAGRRIYQ